MLTRGLYLVIEGLEGSGKSSAMKGVAARLRRDYPELAVRTTRHPGATPLGAHLRTLNKYPETIDPNIRLNPLASQLLMVVDNTAFVSEILGPALREGVMVLADRSNFISSIAYGLADGLDLTQLNLMFALARPPRADRVYVLRVPWETAKQRMIAQDGGDGVGLDRFERKGDEFFRRVQKVYDGLVSGGPELTSVVNRSVSLENIRYVDATRGPEAVVEEILKDVRGLLSEYRA